MTSQNNTLRCAASTRYSMAGANTPSGALKGPIEDGSGWLGGIVCSLLAPQARNRQHACLSFVRDAPAKAHQVRWPSEGARINGVAVSRPKPFTLCATAAS